MAVVSTGQITITDVNDYTYQGTTAPKNPIPNVTIWIDTSVSPSVMKRWTGTAWEIVNEVNVGGRNYLRNSGNFTNTNYWNLYTALVSYSVEGKTLKIEGGTSGMPRLRSTQYIVNGHRPQQWTFTIEYSSAIFVPQFGGKIGLTDTTSEQDSWDATLVEHIDLGNNNRKSIYTWTAPAYSSTTPSFFIFVFPGLSNTIYLKSIKAEKGNKATDWTPAPEDVDSAILTAQNSANTANNLLAEISNDNILTPSEKQNTKKEWDIIVSEKSVVESQATALGVSATSYVNSYNSLSSYITPLLSNLTVNSTIVGSDFRANFKNYYDAKIALLKAVTDKLKYNTDNIQVGGRNLLLNSKNEWNLENSGWVYVELANKLEAGKTYILSAKFFENIGDTLYAIGLNLLNGAGDYFSAIPLNEPFIATAVHATKTHFCFANQTGAGKVSIHYPKLEKGNKATDWTSAPEDIDAKISAEAQKVINLENKTDFLTGTTIEGNAVATGTLLVGNSDGTNAGITGLGGVNDVRFWAGSNFENRGTANWLMRENGIEEQWFNGVLIRKIGIINGNYSDILYNLDGKIAKKISIVNGKILEQWYNDGVIVYEVGQNGIYYVAEIPESFTFFKLLNLSSDIESTDGTVFHSFIRQNMFQKTSNPSRFILQGNTDSYQYNAGQNAYSQGNKQYEGFKTTQNKLSNMPNGWYAFSESGAMLEDTPMGTKRQANLIRLSNGKIINQVSTFIETAGYSFNQF